MKQYLNVRSIVSSAIVILAGLIVILLVYNWTQSTTIDKMALWNSSTGTHLRGANVFQRPTYSELDGIPSTLRPMGPNPVGPPYTQKDFDQLAALGANFVVISYPGLFSETAPYTLDHNIQDNLDNLLAMITKADMFAVISFRTGPGRSEFTFHRGQVDVWFNASYLNDQVWKDPAAQDAWVEMWRYTAERYRDNPAVVGYELMVEPNANEVWLQIWDPQVFYKNYSGTLYDWHQLYPRITAAIRQVDDKTPILISSMEYGDVKWLPYLQPTQDSRTIYTVHQLEPFEYIYQDPEDLTIPYPCICDIDSDGNEDVFNRAWFENRLAGVDVFMAIHNAPVAVTEFGVVRYEPGAAKFMDDQMDAFEQRGINYAVWLWDTSWGPYTEKVAEGTSVQFGDDFNFRYGPDPENHMDVDSSPLIDAIVNHWENNTIRPSNVQKMLRMQD